MKIETKYAIGDKVAGIVRRYVSRIVKCQCCQNSGSVTINGEQFTCPKCGGKADHPINNGEKWFVDFYDSKVGTVRFNQGLRHNCNYNIPDDAPVETEITYMVEETGIGSGSVWDEHLLFPSREEAQAECNRLNAVLKPDEA